MSFSVGGVLRTLKWKDGHERRARWHIIGFAASFCIVCLVELISAGCCGEELGSLAKANQDFQKAMQIWGDGRSAEAETLLDDALSIRQQRLSPDDPAIAQVIERLGVISFNRGKYGKAEEQFRKALNIDLTGLGERNIATAYVMGDLGAALREQHRCRDAQTIVEHSLALYRELLPPNHPLVAIRLRNLALIYICEHRYADARQALHESLDIFVAQSAKPGIRIDQALLTRVDNAEHEARQLVTWGLMLGAGALTSLAVLLACNLWSEHRLIVNPTNRPFAVRIAAVTALVSLFGTVGVLCSFAVDRLILEMAPSIVSDRYSLQNVGKLGFFAGIWLSMIALQVFSNVGRRVIGLPTRPMVYFHWSALQTILPLQIRNPGDAGPLLQSSPGSIPWFSAMEYYAVILNRTYKVFVADKMLCGAKVRGLVSNPMRPSRQMLDQTFWVQTRSAQIYERVDVTSETFLHVNSANFHIKWQQIAEIEYRAGRKWGMGSVPHSGRLVIHLRSGGSRELILLGRQDGDALKERLDEMLKADSATPETN